MNDKNNINGAEIQSDISDISNLSEYDRDDNENTPESDTTESTENGIESHSDEVSPSQADEFEFIEGEEYVAAPKKNVFQNIFSKENIKKYRYLSLAFVVPALTMWLIYIAMGTYPFGNGSVLVLDLNGQYVYYFEQLREIILGDGSFLYSFGRALGGEFMGIYAYYLASPFSFIVCLFPKEMITEALLCMFLLKTGLCGLTFGIYLHYKTPEHRLNRIAVVLFSTMYALTAFAVVQQHNTMWIDNLILLPLIVMGIERMIKYHRFRLFVISLTIAVMSNFYIGYMMCIFVLVYFFVCYLSMSPEERNPRGEEYHFGKSFLRIAGSALLVISMSAVMIWSAYYSLTFGKTTFSNPNFEFKSKFDLLDLISKLFIGSYDTVRPEGLPFVYSGSLTLLLVPLYFIIKKIPLREKIANAFMVVFFVFSFTGSTIDLVWHGFQRPNWLNYRYSFILCFFLVFCAYRAFLYIKEIDVKAVIIDVAFWVMMLVLLQKLDTYDWISDYGTVWLSFAFFAAYLILLRFEIISNVKNGVSLAIASVVVLECFVGGLLNLVALGDDVVYSKRTSYRNYVDRVQPIVDMIQENDDSFYRMEKTFHRKTNDPLALGFRGLSNSTSTLNAKTIRFLRELGLSSKSHWSKYLGGTPMLDMLLGVKYVIIEEGDPMTDIYNEIYQYQHSEDFANLIAYENPYALPIAYGVDTSLLEYLLSNEESPFERMNSLATLMTGSDEDIEVYVPLDIIESDYKGLKLTFTTGHKVYTSDSSDKTGSVYYKFVTERDGNVYCYFPSDYARECDLYLNGSKYSEYFGNETCRVIDLGWFEAGETVEVSLHLTENEKLYIGNENTFFYYVDDVALASVYEELSASAYNITEYTEDSFYGTIDVQVGDELIFTTIPYDEGWVITVDGKEVSPVIALDAVLAFYVSPGTHEVSLEYRPDCVIYGRYISLVGFIAFIGVCTVDFVIRRKRSY